MERAKERDMANDSRLEITIDEGVDAAPEEEARGERRAPTSVWINQPSSEIAPHGRGAKAFIGALVVLAVLATAAVMSREDPLVAPAMAGTETELTGMTGNGPTGYFPDRFERGAGEIESLPATF
jgi:hypothetical protein